MGDGHKGSMLTLNIHNFFKINAPVKVNADPPPKKKAHSGLRGALVGIY